MTGGLLFGENKTPATWPAAIGTHLAQSRRDGRSFPAAWEAAIYFHPPEEALANIFANAAHEEYVRWTQQLFASAYARRPFPEGVAPLNVEPYGDTAEGVSASQGAREGHSAPTRPTPTHCRWGDDCARGAGHGRFGNFCKMHARDLAGLDMSPDFQTWGGRGVDESRKRGAKIGAEKRTAARLARESAA